MFELVLCVLGVGCFLFWLVSRNSADRRDDDANRTTSETEERVIVSSPSQPHGAPTMSSKATDFLGGVHPTSKRPYPVLTTDMVTGVDGQLSYEDCKKVIRLYLKAIDFQSERGRASDIDSIHGWMVEYEDFPRKCAIELNEGIAVHRAQLREKRQNVKICKDKALRKSIVEEIEYLQFEIEGALDQIEGIKEEIKQLKGDRLVYLIDNINRHVHGKHWRTVCNRPVWPSMVT